MKRKLISVMLSVFAMLLLMGAAADTEPAASLLAEEESTVSDETALETEAQLPEEVTDPAEEEGSANTPAEEDDSANTPVEEEDSTKTPSLEGSPLIPSFTTGDPSLLINGVPAPLELNKEMQDGVTYVSLSVMARQLAPNAQISWNGSAATVVTDQLTLTAEVGQLYVVANGRYLYTPELVQINHASQVIVPLRVVAKAFDAAVGYDAATGLTTVTSGSGAILNGESFYNPDDLFWLSRVIHRESGNQPMEGRMAVGNVVLNRVADPVFPDTVEGVLAQKNQFSTYKSGVLAATDPSKSSTIAAKLVMDGGVVEETRGALYFDSGINSWAARNKELIATIGGHKFYG